LKTAFSAKGESRKPLFSGVKTGPFAATAFSLSRERIMPENAVYR
jgi:hypothetical protein